MHGPALLTTKQHQKHSRGTEFLVTPVPNIPAQNSIRHLGISHNSPYLLRKFCITFIFHFSCVTAVPREIKNNAYAKFWGQMRCITGDV